MGGFASLIPNEHREEFLTSFLDAYVGAHGLGALSKADLDALIVHLFVRYSLKGQFDAYRVAQALKLKESRAKSLYESGLIKYGSLTEGAAWRDILTMLAKTTYELESYERGQIRFRFGDPALYKFIQLRLRRIERTASYSPAYESVVIGLGAFLELLNHVYDKSQTDFKSTEMDAVRPLVEPVLKRLASTLGKTKLKELTKGAKAKSVAGQALEAGSKLASIGGFVKALFFVGAVL